MKAKFKSRLAIIPQEQLDKIRQFLGIKSPLLILTVEEHKEEVVAFLKKKKAWEGKTGWERYLDVELTTWYRKRTINQLNLFFEICTRIGQKIGQTPEEVYLGIKEIHYPRQEVMDGVWAPIPSANQTTVQYAQVLEAAINQAFEVAADIYDIWLLFTEWRFGQTKDPLEGTYADVRDYRDKRPLCEACGKYLLITDGEGIQGHNGKLSYIVLDGNRSADSNWLIMCTEHHIESKDEQAWIDLVKMYPHLRWTINRARKRYGLDSIGPDDSPSPPISDEAADDDFVDDIPGEESAKEKPADPEQNYDENGKFAIKPDF